MIKLINEKVCGKLMYEIDHVYDTKIGTKKERMKKVNKIFIGLDYLALNIKDKFYICGYVNGRIWNNLLREKEK